MSGGARIIGTLLAAAAAGGLLLAAPALWWPLALGWLVACWYTTPPAAEDGQPGTDPAEFLRLVHRLAEGRKAGVHLAEIAQALTGSPTATATVRELCETVGIPISPGVRVKGRGVSTGVKTVDLPPLPGPSPDGPVGVVVAGQSEQQQQQHALAWIIPDPSGDPHRYALKYPQEPAPAGA
jgi:hypothetical protein